MAKHLLHLGFLLAVGALALKAAFMPPRLQASLRPGEHAMLDGDILVLKGFSVPKYPSGKPRQYESDVHVVSVAREAGAAAVRQSAKAATAWADVSSYAASRLGHDRPAPPAKLSNPATATDKNCKA